MKTSVLTSGPYLEMLWEGWFTPKKRSDDTFVFVKPRGKLNKSVLLFVNDQTSC